MMEEKIGVSTEEAVRSLTEGYFKSYDMMLYNWASIHVSNCKKGFTVPQIVIEKRCETYNISGQDCVKCSHYDPNIEIKHNPRGKWREWVKQSRQDIKRIMRKYYTSRERAN